MKKFTILFSLLAIAFSLSGQKLTSSFGKVDLDDMTLAVYEPDTTAPAIVLYQSGYFRASDFKFIFLRRVKVLKKDGANYAEFTFRSDVSTSVRGKVYNMVNGKIVEEKLKSESIYKDRIIGDLYMYRIAIPNVQVGTVFEIEYSQELLPANFRFQDVIPVIRAELLLETNFAIDYRKTKIGYCNVKGTDQFFYADYLPAFKAEGYLNSIENYITKFDFDIYGITIGGVLTEFTSTWMAVSKLLDQHEYFGIVSRTSAAYLNDVADDINSRCNTPMEKTVAAYNALKAIKWNNEIRLFSSVPSLRVPFALESGNSTELNMMLYQLLQKLRVESSLLVMSTRDEGLLHPVFPTIEKLNYTIACATIDGKDYPMDITDLYIPFGMLPPRALNQQARVVDVVTGGRWVDLTPIKKDKETATYELSMTPDLDFEGTMAYSMNDYAAYKFRTDYHTYSSEEKFVEHLEDVCTGLEVREYEFVNIDKIDSACLLKMSVAIKGVTQKAGTMIMLNPLLFEQVTYNPFKSENRTYPVDYGLKTETGVTVRINIAEGYVVESIPKNSKVGLENGDATFILNYKNEGNSLLITYNFQINKLSFLPTEYSNLRNLYIELIKKHSEPIVLKKLTDDNNN